MNDCRFQTHVEESILVLTKRSRLGTKQEQGWRWLGNTKNKSRCCWSPKKTVVSPHIAKKRASRNQLLSPAWCVTTSIMRVSNRKVNFFEAHPELNEKKQIIIESLRAIDAVNSKKCSHEWKH